MKFIQWSFYLPILALVTLLLGSIIDAMSIYDKNKGDPYASRTPLTLFMVPLLALGGAIVAVYSMFTFSNLNFVDIVFLWFAAAVSLILLVFGSLYCMFVSFYWRQIRESPNAQTSSTHSDESF